MLFEKITYLSPEGRLVREAFVQIEQNKISYIGKKAPQGALGEHIDGRTLLLLPAFADAHCHVPMTLLRGFGEGLPLQRWLTERIFPFEDLLTDEDAYWGALLGISELLASGCVSFSDMYMNLPGIFRAVEESGIKANLSHGCTSIGQDLPFEETNAFRGTSYLLENCPALPHNRIIPDLALHAEYTSGETTCRSIAAFAKKHGLRLQIHLSETETEHREAKERRGGRTPLAYFRDCGILENPVTFAHAVYLEDSDYALLKSETEKGADITLVHNPSSNLKLGSGLANLKRWQECGVKIAIGTDGPSSNNNLNMLEELSLASLLQKGVTRDSAFMGPLETLTAASRTGFLSQGRCDSGLIQEGARADLVVFELDRPHLTPDFDILSNIVYAADRNDIVMTISDGRIVYRDGQFPTLDIRRVMQEVRRICREKERALACD